MTTVCPSNINNNNSSSNNNKQVLKEIKETLEKEFNDISQVNQVIMKLAQRKTITIDDIDAAREMMKINFKRKSISQMRQRKDLQQSSTLETTNNLMSSNHNTIAQKQISPPRQQQQQQQQFQQVTKSLNINGNALDSNYPRPRLNVSLVKTKPKRNNILANILSPQQTSQSGLFSSDRQNDNNPFNRKTEEVHMAYQQKQLDPWKALIQDDINKYQQQQLLNLNVKKQTQANYKEYLEKQIEQIRTKKSLEQQKIQQESEQLNDRVKFLEQKEKEQMQSVRNKFKNLVEQNDQLKVNLLLQKQKEQQKLLEQDRKQADEAAQRDRMKILNEQWEKKAKQQKVSQDLDFIKSQQQQQQQSYKNSQRVSPRSPRDGEAFVEANPFIDKADIQRHRRKVQELNAISIQNVNNFEISHNSPKEQTIQKMENADINISTILEDRNMMNKHVSRQFFKQMSVDNKNLSLIKSRAKLEIHNIDILQDKKFVAIDNENQKRAKELEMLVKKRKQQEQLNTLDEQMKINQEIKKQSQFDISANELALNKKRFQNLEIIGGLNRQIQ